MKNKYPLQAFALVNQVANMLDSLPSLNDEQQNILDNCNTLLTHLRECHDSPFMEHLRMKHAADYTWTDDDMPDAFEDWYASLDLQEEFDSFLN